jgi:calcium-dependent protein kinase
VQVIDLGSAEFVLIGQEVPHAFGTVRYSSPEMAAHSAGPASDVWSAGVLLCHVLTGRVPFLKDNDLDTLEFIRKGPEVSSKRCCMLGLTRTK